MRCESQYCIFTNFCIAHKYFGFAGLRRETLTLQHKRSSAAPSTQGLLVHSVVAGLSTNTPEGHILVVYGRLLHLDLALQCCMNSRDWTESVLPHHLEVCELLGCSVSTPRCTAYSAQRCGPIWVHNITMADPYGPPLQLPPLVHNLISGCALIVGKHAGGART